MHIDLDGDSLSQRSSSSIAHPFSSCPTTSLNRKPPPHLPWFPPPREKPPVRPSPARTSAYRMSFPLQVMLIDVLPFSYADSYAHFGEP